MYNHGKRKLKQIVELVKIRNKKRNAILGNVLKQKRKNKSGPNILDAFNQETNQKNVRKGKIVLI